MASNPASDFTEGISFVEESERSLATIGK